MSCIVKCFKFTLFKKKTAKSIKSAKSSKSYKSAQSSKHSISTELFRFEARRRYSCDESMVPPTCNLPELAVNILNPARSQPYLGRASRIQEQQMRESQAAEQSRLRRKQARLAKKARLAEQAEADRQAELEAVSRENKRRAVTCPVQSTTTWCEDPWMSASVLANFREAEANACQPSSAVAKEPYLNGRFAEQYEPLSSDPWMSDTILAELDECNKAIRLPDAARASVYFCLSNESLPNLSSVTPNASARWAAELNKNKGLEMEQYVWRILDLGLGVGRPILFIVRNGRIIIRAKRSLLTDDTQDLYLGISANRFRRGNYSDMPKELRNPFTWLDASCWKDVARMKVTMEWV